MQKVDSWLENKKLYILILVILFPFLLYLVPYDWIFSNEGTVCIYKNITGKECIGCGMTRAIFSLLYFNFKDAYAYNKLVIIVTPLLFYLWSKYILKSIRAIKNK